ncbi:hypothetical protein MQE23_35810 [Streptomyces sp. HP-A2021]|uniref:hypothetical protein n=1 Tax=Streptomyces sp. HP-A2021 TaxID=2927875 RepID=UPI001FAE8462|nr:hypothetical protein [Streptomyces sp. HP-A2021]UOB15911.1 hypothetical protein MQE23_35810 [Streptomyces sp. HP-A2021]
MGGDGLPCIRLGRNYDSRLGRRGGLRERDRLGHRCGLRDRSGCRALLRSSLRGLLTTVGGFSGGTRPPGYVGSTIGERRFTVLAGTVHDRPRRILRNRRFARLRLGHRLTLRANAHTSGLTSNPGLGRGHLVPGGTGTHAGGVTHDGRTHNGRTLGGNGLLRLVGGHRRTGGLVRRRRSLRGLFGVDTLRRLLRVGALRGTGRGRRCRGDRLRGDPGGDGLGRAGLLRCRNNRFRRRRPGAHRGLGRNLRAPGRGGRRGRLRGARAVEVLGAGRRPHGLSYRRFRGAAVGERAHRAGGAVGERRAEVQRPARGDRRDRRRVGQADAAEVDRAAVAAGELVRARLVHGLDDRLRRGRGDLVAPGAMGARQQQVLVLDGVLGEVGVRTVRGGARLFHHACALRQSLARDLAGVGHAYPSPIG